MFQELALKGLKIPDQFQGGLSQKISKLKELSPCDSMVEVSIEKRINSYFMSISIHHQEGEISVSAQSPNLEKLTRSCFNKIHCALRDWKKGRFVGVIALEDWTKEYPKESRHV